MRRLPLALLTAALSATPAFAGDCAALKSLQLPDTTLTLAEPTRDKLTPPYGSPIDKLPSFCRVAGILHPTPDSVIHFEVWMPELTSEAPTQQPTLQAWNGRLLGTGNGGFAGSLYYDQMASLLKRGYAVSGSDAGHEAEAEDASFAFHHPEKVEDFGWRAVHLTALRSKDILAAFYGHPQQKAYFDACSDGGREALMEAQRFPEDYDGILAGAPANNWTHLVTGGIDVLQTMIKNGPEGYISSLKLPTITRAALAACDAQDGLKDGILSDPQSCRFDPAVLLCKGADNLDCLTTPQVTTLKKIYNGGIDSHGKLIHPGTIPGDEAGSWKDWITGGAPGGGNYGNNYFRYMVTGDPTWNALTANVDDALRQAVEKTGKPLDATDPDLSRFAAHGGKLLMYHGWNDPAISPLNSIAYFKSVQQQMGVEAANTTVQLYLVPGMEHCAGGPGPNNLGQLGIQTAASPGALDLLQLWVEKDQQPHMILASKTLPAKLPAETAMTASIPSKRRTMAKSSPKPAALPPTPDYITRPLCPYPQQQRYNGTGNPNLPTSFHCE